MTIVLDVAFHARGWICMLGLVVQKEAAASESENNT